VKSNSGPCVQESDNGRRLPIVALAGFISPVILLCAALLGSWDDTAVLAIISLALFSLLIMRMRWLFARIVSQSTSLTQALTERGSLEEELRRLAFHDGLTGLPNRCTDYGRQSLGAPVARSADLPSSLFR